MDKATAENSPSLESSLDKSSKLDKLLSLVENMNARIQTLERSAAATKAPQPPYFYNPQPPKTSWPQTPEASLPISTPAAAMQQMLQTQSAQQVLPNQVARQEDSPMTGAMKGYMLFQAAKKML